MQVLNVNAATEGLNRMFTVTIHCLHLTQRGTNLGNCFNIE